MAASHPHLVHDMGTPRDSPLVMSWMTVSEARAALVGAGQRALPVVGHDGLIGLITIEAVSGDVGDHRPATDEPVLAVMDWHLVQVPPQADDGTLERTYADAARTWVRTRGREAETPDHLVHHRSGR